jgi:hypothetical protein
MATNTCHISNAVAPVRGKWRNLLCFCMLFGVWVDLAAYKECADSIREFFFCLFISQSRNVYFGSNSLVWPFSRSNSLRSASLSCCFQNHTMKSLYCKTRITQLIRKDQCMGAFEKQSALKNGILLMLFWTHVSTDLYFECPWKLFRYESCLFGGSQKEREIQNLPLLLALNYEKDGPQVFSKRFYRVHRGLTAYKSHFVAVKGFVFS